MRRATSRVRLVGWSAAGLLVAGLIGLMGWALGHPDAGPAPTSAVRQAPDLTVRTFDGDLVRLVSLRGEPVVLNFWASWCEPCRQEAPALAEGARTVTAVHFIGVAIQDDETSARRFRQEFNPPYPVGIAVSGSYLAFGVTGPPETYFIDRQGMIRSRFAGPLDVATLRAHVDAIS